MARDLKEILLKIAHLPLFDQRWILRQLTQEKMDTLKKRQGLSLLESAQRFRKLGLKNLSVPLSSTAQLPAFCQDLAGKSPLYTAIVIEQGNYPWQALFLQQFDKEGHVKSSLETQVPDIKPLVKQAIFTEWEKAHCFETYLEDKHG